MRITNITLILSLTFLLICVNGKSIGQDKCCGKDLSGCCQDGTECCNIYNKSAKTHDYGCCGIGELCCGSNKCCGVNQTCCGSSCCSDECFFNFACLPRFGLSNNVFLGIAAGIIIIVILLIVLIITCSCMACHNRSKKRKSKQNKEKSEYIEMDSKNGNITKSGSMSLTPDSQGDTFSSPKNTFSMTHTFVSTASIIKQVSRNFTDDDKQNFIVNCQNIKPFICGIIRLYVFEKIDLDEYSLLIATAYSSTIARPLSANNVENCIQIIENAYTLLVEEGEGNRDTMVPAGLEMLKNMLRSSQCESFAESLNLLRSIVERAVDSLGNDSSGDTECVIKYCIGAAMLNFSNENADSSAFGEEFKIWIEPFCANSCSNGGCGISEFGERQKKYDEMFESATNLLTSLTENTQKI